MQQIYRKQHLCQSVISIKLQRNFIEITLCHGCFPVNLLHIFRTPFLKNTSGWLLLNIFFYGNNISLSDCNWTRTHNHLVHKRIMASLAKWLNVRLWTKWLWVQVQLQPLKLQISRLLWTRSSLTFRQL